MKVDLKTLIQTTVPQEVARSIFHWHGAAIADWESVLVENYLDRNFITVNCLSSDRRLLKFKIYEDGELFAGEYVEFLPAESNERVKDDWLLQQKTPISSDYILFTILKEYLL